MGAVGGDGDALPLGAPVLDPVQSDDGFTLDDIGEMVVALYWPDVEGRGYFRGLATPALLCHIEPARSKQNTPLGVFCAPKPLVGGFGCDELVLYGIRELA